MEESGMCATAHSRRNHNSLLPTLGNNENCSVLLRFVNSVIGHSGQAMELINLNFRFF